MESLKVSDLDGLSRKAIQSLCKERHIKANSKTVVMIAALKQWCADNAAATCTAVDDKSEEKSSDMDVDQSNVAATPSPNMPTEAERLAMVTVGASVLAGPVSPVPPAAFCVVHGTHVESTGTLLLVLRGGQVYAGKTPFVLSPCRAPPTRQYYLCRLRHSE